MSVCDWHQLFCGLNDLVIRRRLRQKMDFLNEDLGAQRRPTEAELQAYLDAHAEKFAAPARTSFNQVYLKHDRNPAVGRKRADEVRVQLSTGSIQPSEAGDATLLPRGLENASAREISRSFGEVFIAALEQVPVGAGWSGPIETEYGLHLVNVSNARFARVSLVDHLAWRIGGDQGLLEHPRLVRPIPLVPDPGFPGRRRSDPDLERGANAYLRESPQRHSN